MAYINFAVALLLLLPAAVFFLLGKEVVIAISGKVPGVARSLGLRIKACLNKFKKRCEKFFNKPLPQTIFNVIEEDKLASEAVEEIAQKVIEENAEKESIINEPVKTDELVKAVEPVKVEQPVKAEDPIKTEEPAKTEIQPKTEIPVKSDEPAINEEPVIMSLINTNESEKTSNNSKDIEYAVRKQFDDLDMITVSAIGIMLSDTKSKAASPYIESLKKPDMRVILLKFCKDSFFATDIDQLESLYTKSYYKWKITRYLSKVTVFVKRGIGDSMPRSMAFRKARITKNRIINRVCETIGTFESVKYISALSGNEEISASKRNYKLDHLSENYKDALIYLVDLLLTCTCISKMLFVERVVKKMDDNSEFKKIITNMAQSIDNHNLIINKSRPIYKQYYRSELGFLSGDDYLYGMAITIMVNNAKKVAIQNTDILKINSDARTTREFKNEMQKWLDELSIDDAIDDIGTLILHKITLSIKNNYGLLTNALQELTNWENFYSQRVNYYKKERDKNRYLIGDFEKERKELINERNGN